MHSVSRPSSTATRERHTPRPPWVDLNPARWTRRTCRRTLSLCQTALQSGPWGHRGVGPGLPRQGCLAVWAAAGPSHHSALPWEKARMYISTPCPDESGPPMHLLIASLKLNRYQWNCLGNISRYLPKGLPNLTLINTAIVKISSFTNGRSKIKVSVQPVADHTLLLTLATDNVSHSDSKPIQNIAFTNKDKILINIFRQKYGEKKILRQKTCVSYSYSRCRSSDDAPNWRMAAVDQQIIDQAIKQMAFMPLIMCSWTKMTH